MSTKINSNHIVKAMVFVKRTITKNKTIKFNKIFSIPKKGFKGIKGRS